MLAEVKRPGGCHAAETVHGKVPAKPQSKHPSLSIASHMSLIEGQLTPNIQLSIIVIMKNTTKIVLLCEKYEIYLL